MTKREIELYFELKEKIERKCLEYIIWNEPYEDENGKLFEDNIDNIQNDGENILVFYSELTTGYSNSYVIPKSQLLA